MRTIYEIQKEIAATSHKLNNLILEKKILLQMMWSREAEAKELAERAIAKMKETND